jgi:hypothetical protein
MRVEVNCSRCVASVLVLDVPPMPGGDGKIVDSGAQSRQLLNHGWINAASGPVCADCRHLPAPSNPRAKPEATPAKPAKTKGKR